MTSHHRKEHSLYPYTKLFQHSPEFNGLTTKDASCVNYLWTRMTHDALQSNPLKFRKSSVFNNNKAIVAILYIFCQHFAIIDSYKYYTKTSLLSGLCSRKEIARIMKPLVYLENLSKSFQEGSAQRVVLNHVSTTFAEGEFTVLLGKSGSGKSTLLNLISGMEKPSTGQITIGDVPITALSERKRTLFRRDHIGFVFQFFNLIPTLTVLENVTLPQELAGRNGRSAKESALNLLTQVGLADRRDTFPDKLSGGEQQRVAIARALAHDPMLLLADEPTGNLDEETGERILSLLLNLTRETGKTLIMATHSPEIVPFADRVFRVHEGHLEETSHQEGSHGRMPMAATL
jgi:putative ABC transport system ATP-binding protein